MFNVCLFDAVVVKVTRSHSVKYKHAPNRWHGKKSLWTTTTTIFIGVFIKRKCCCTTRH